MKETIKVVLTLIFINFFILGCIDKNAANTGASIEGECNLDTYYINTPEPLRSFSNTNIDAPTIILVHGKNASPEDPHMQDLADDFNFDGYNVLMPYMSWYGFQWNSTYCDSISYLNYLIVKERAETSQDIILAGYNLGGTVALAYTAMSNTVKPDALNILAPSHLIHQSTAFANANADSITEAKSMLENNQTQEERTFNSYNYNNDSVASILTTPEIYLSFHDVEEFPNIESTTPLIRVPMLWLAGESDPLTTLAVSLGIIDLIPSSETYEVLPGDYNNVLNQASYEFDAWYNDI